MDKESLFKILKNKNNQRIFLIVIIGLMFISFFGEGQNPKQKSAEVDPVANEELRLGKILSDIDNVGDVSVMITYYGTSEKNIAYEKRKNISSLGESESYDEKAVLTDGEPLIASESYPRVKGVIVTADGADIAGVRENLINAVSAAMGVEKHKICIYKKRR